MVAVAWMIITAAHVGSPVSRPSLFVLAASAWLVYQADRLLDVRRPRASHAHGLSAAETVRRTTSRHQFVGAHQVQLMALWGLVFAANAAVALSSLDPRTLATGTGVLAVAALTLPSVSRRTRTGILVRALAVGAAFAGAVAMFLEPSGLLAAGPALGVLAALCTANVLYASSWERDLDDGAPTPARTFSPAALVLLVAVACAVWWSRDAQPLAAWAACAACLLLGIDRVHDRLGTDTARALGDLALLVPLASLL